jgi:hypothetical protein
MDWLQVLAIQKDIISDLLPSVCFGQLAKSCKAGVGIADSYHDAWHARCWLAYEQFKEEHQRRAMNIHDLPRYQVEQLD